MQWTDEAIILSARKLGERSGIVSLLTREHGRYHGVDAAAFTRPRRGIYEQGNQVSAHWKARLSEQIGTIGCEMTQPVAALLLDHAGKLAVLQSACALVDALLPEREPHPDCYAQFCLLNAVLCGEGDFLACYARFELLLLQASGFGLDLQRCAATGIQEDLVYVSPRSGRAVSREAGTPYHTRLLTLPDFLLRDTSDELIAPSEIRAALTLSGHFLEARVFSQTHRPLPAARLRLLRLLARKRPENAPVRKGLQPLENTL